jgi:hypothetical protein
MWPREEGIRSAYKYIEPALAASKFVAEAGES